MNNPLYDKDEWWYKMVSFPDHFPFLWISRYFAIYTFQTILVYNVYQIPFKLNRSIRGLFFSIVWDTECCILVTFNTTMIRKSHWLPFRQSEYKTRQFPKILYYVRRILYTIHSYHAILMGIYHDKTVMSIIDKHRVFCSQLYRGDAEFPRIKLKIRDCFQYCKSVTHLIYIKISKIRLHWTHFCCTGKFWSFTTPFRIPCRTW